MGVSVGTMSARKKTINSKVLYKFIDILHPNINFSPLERAYSTHIHRVDPGSVRWVRMNHPSR